ncbi:Yip1 family protein [Acetobacterium sp.]|uniref:Yip1 family protein n=1 Tax=Acetobacterium sp. TaxID=1872094 RepID=UPI002F429551
MNFINLFIHPVKYFTQIKEKEKTSLIIPIVILVTIGIISGFRAGNVLSGMELPADQAAGLQALAIGAGIFSGIIGLGIAVVVKAGIFHFILKKMKGTGTFKSGVYVVGIGYFPKIFQGIINLLFPQTIDPITVSQFDWVTLLAGVFSIFNIWQLIITIIGLSVVYGVSYRKTAIPVIGLEVISAGITFAITWFTANAITGLPTTTVK